MSPKRHGVRKLLDKFRLSGKKGNKESENRGQEGSSFKGPEPEVSISSASEEVFRLVRQPGSSSKGSKPEVSISSTSKEVVRLVRQPGPKFLEFISINELVWQLIGLLDLSDILSLHRTHKTLAARLQPFVLILADKQHWIRVGGPPAHKFWSLAHLPRLEHHCISNTEAVAPECREFSLIGSTQRLNPDVFDEICFRPAKSRDVFLHAKVLDRVETLMSQMSKLHTIRWTRIICSPSMVARFPDRHPELKCLIIEYPLLMDYPLLHSRSHDGQTLMDPPRFNLPASFIWGLETLVLHNIYHNENSSQYNLRGRPWDMSIARLLSMCPSLQNLSLSYGGPSWDALKIDSHQFLFYNICNLYAGLSPGRPLKLRSLRLHNIALTPRASALPPDAPPHLPLLTDLSCLEDVSLSSIMHMYSFVTRGLEIFTQKRTPALRSLDVWRGGRTSSGRHSREIPNDSIEHWVCDASPEFIRQLAILHTNNKMFVDMVKAGKTPRMVTLTLGGGSAPHPEMFNFKGDGGLLLDCLAKLATQDNNLEGIRLQIMMPLTRLLKRISNTDDDFLERWWWWAIYPGGLCEILGWLSKLEQVELCLVPTPGPLTEYTFQPDKSTLGSYYREHGKQFLTWLGRQIIGTPGSRVKYIAYSYSWRLAGWEGFDDKFDFENYERPFMAWWVSEEGRKQAATAARAERELFTSIFGEVGVATGKDLYGRERSPSLAALRALQRERFSRPWYQRIHTKEKIFPCAGWVPLTSKEIMEVELFRLVQPTTVLSPDQKNHIPACQSNLVVETSDPNGTDGCFEVK